MVYVVPVVVLKPVISPRVNDNKKKRIIETFGLVDKYVAELEKPREKVLKILSSLDRMFSREWNPAVGKYQPCISPEGLMAALKNASGHAGKETGKNGVWGLYFDEKCVCIDSKYITKKNGEKSLVNFEFVVPKSLGLIVLDSADSIPAELRVRLCYVGGWISRKYGLIKILWEEGRETSMRV